MVGNAHFAEFALFQQRRPVSYPALPMINWNSTLETGVAVIDNDHRTLIEQINLLEEALQQGAGKDRLGELVAFLDKYTRMHFAREEALMTERKCPVSGLNCTAHLLLLQKLDAWNNRLNASGATTSLVLEINREMGAWITQHIIKIDCRINSPVASA